MAKRDQQKYGIDFYEVHKQLSKQKYVSKAELNRIFVAMNPSISASQARSVVYSLEKENYIYASGSGIFTVTDPQNRTAAVKSKFVPKISTSLDSLIHRIDTDFPYLECVYWESNNLHDFMVNQPKINIISLDVEKGYEASVFDLLQQKISLDIFLSPDSATIERYVSTKDEPVIVSSLVSQAPKADKGKMHHYARIEKILVDILVEKNKFFPYQGDELVNIYENVFDKLLINEDSLLRYAQRRSAADSLKEFILNQTNIKLRKFAGDNHDLK